MLDASADVALSLRWLYLVALAGARRVWKSVLPGLAFGMNLGWLG
jgi:hypothetical protein